MKELAKEADATFRWRNLTTGYRDAEWLRLVELYQFEGARE